ncbi:MAG TPA: hypothetical protein VMO47_01940 [Rhodothermales bacterium]|nr:hypothetical protein [Rhodothermales bacterium]
MERKLTIPLFVASLVLLAHCATERPPSQIPASEATFVFRGSVSEAQSSTLEQLEASDVTYAVVVDEVVHQEGTFDDQTGRTVTVIAADRKLEPGGSFVFYTEPFMFGTSVAVHLVRASSDDRPSAVIGEEVKRDLENGRLRERVREAEFIVAGVVTHIDTTRERVRIESEHVPDLRQASLKVSEVLKGDLSAEEVAFLFAASIDIQWYQSPKFTGGEEGIFLLNRDSDRLKPFGVGGQTLTLLHPLDFQPPDKLETIKGLL